jgi:hypothetical protein
MTTTTLTQARREPAAVHPAAPPLFANIVGQRTLIEDVAGASFLVLGAIPAAFFLLMAVLPPTSPVCTDAEVTIQGTAPTHAQNDAPRSGVTEL